MKINHLWMPAVVLLLFAAALSLFWYGKTAAGQTIYETAESIDYSEYQDYEDIVTMYMTVSRGNSDELTHLSWDEVNALPMSYYKENEMEVQYGSEALIQVGDENGLNQRSFGVGINIPNAVVTLRGDNASMKPQKSYRIEFKTFADNWNDQNIIYLNKYSEDGVRFRTALAQELADVVPDITPLDTTFVHLYVNDKTVEGEDVFIDYGLYTQLERPDSDFLQRVGLDMNGELYKAENFDFSRHPETIKLTSDPDYSFEAFESLLENKGDNEDHSDLINMLDAVNAPDADIEQILRQYFDEENYYNFLALQILLGNASEATRGYLLYSPSDDGKFRFLMWDTDHILYNTEEELINRKYDIRREAIEMTTGVLPYYNNKLHKMVLTNENCLKKLTQKLDELTPIVYDNVRLFSMEYSASIKPLCFIRPDITSMPLSAENYDVISNRLNNEISDNANRFRAEIKRPSPFKIVSIEAGEKLVIDWEDAITSTDESISYHFIVAKRYTLLQDIYNEEGLTESLFECDILEPGQYFISITASDPTGNTRKLNSYYEDIFDSRHAGIFCFYVNLDGSVSWQTL
ncbi:MAG: CotH kinase family protein [Ruminococcus sp.]|jgi:spore coat protein H|nr:CotH kinase family protein [Ruminococcus sp.]